MLESCTLIVCPANDVARPVHDRMPAILGQADWARWLDPATPPQAAKGLRAPCPDEWLAAYPVSRAVSFARNEGPELIAAVALAST
ncbi:MAG: SOS response-associated peptidase [Candidatus Contendobacter sp.]|nr:SOS response-associated peptidase [Candidatus Contendobacter sp.]